MKMVRVFGNGPKREIPEVSIEKWIPPEFVENKK